ncbi:MAG TPA: class I SAM-dependent methyltransferase [Bryobacteraceae bacterium]|nr:class I SAM-dependent methyltransferase [Bryobacteraceae bacterium]
MASPPIGRLFRKGKKRIGDCYRWLIDVKFDLLNGVDTSGYIVAEKLGLDRSAHEYIACAEHTILSAFALLPIDFGEFALIDLGCGKGRVLIVAAKRFSFRQIIGVEISEQLVQIARHNVRNFGNVSVVTCDAAHYDVPGEPCVVFLANPFEADILSAVISKLEQRSKYSSCPFYVLYVVPQFQELLDKAPFLQRLPSPAFCAVYASVLFGESAVGTSM